jgi:hypothetical protein
MRTGPLFETFLSDWRLCTFDFWNGGQSVMVGHQSRGVFVTFLPIQSENVCLKWVKKWPRDHNFFRCNDFFVIESFVIGGLKEA